MDDWLPPLDQLPRVLPRAEALARGFSRRAIDHRLATGRWRRLLPGVYLTVDTLTERDRDRGALAYVGRGAVLSGAAALRVAGFERVRRPQQVLVLAPPDNRTQSQAWVRVRNSHRDVRPNAWPGPPHADIARAAADHALGLPRLDDVRALVAMIVRDGRCTLGELATELEAGPRRGSGHLRRAIADVSGGAASAPEARSAALLRKDRRIPPFELNVPIRLPGGRHYVADALWRQLRAVLEVDSAEYHLDAADWRRTMDRHLALTAAGYSVVHRPPSALREPARFCDDVAVWLATRARELAR